MSYIYVATNKVNGKQYVGQHHYDGEGIDGSYKGSGKLIKQAYDKYGTNNFTIDVLEYCSDISLDELEEEFNCDKRIIKKRADKYGIKLNQKPAFEGKKHTEETKKIMKQKAIERWKTRKH